MVNNSGRHSEIVLPHDQAMAAIRNRCPSSSVNPRASTSAGNDWQCSRLTWDKAYADIESWYLEKTAYRQRMNNVAAPAGTSWALARSLFIFRPARAD